MALKLTARFSDRQFLRNARVSGNWTEEEASIAYFPFIPDQPFRVNVTSSNYLLLFGTCKLYTYQHNPPLFRVTLHQIVLYAKDETNNGPFHTSLSQRRVPILTDLLYMPK